MERYGSWQWGCLERGGRLVPWYIGLQRRWEAWSCCTFQDFLDVLWGSGDEEPPKMWGGCPRNQSFKHVPRVTAGGEG